MDQGSSSVCFTKIHCAVIQQHLSNLLVEICELDTRKPTTGRWYLHVFAEGWPAHCTLYEYTDDSDNMECKYVNMSTRHLVIIPCVCQW